MPFHGCIVVIKRSGADGSTFPLVNEVRQFNYMIYGIHSTKSKSIQECLLGRSEGCDIRIQLPIVSKEHCRIIVNDNNEVK